MKNNLSTLFVAAFLLLASSISAQGLDGKKIYVNPGHGSYGWDDRPLSTIPYPILKKSDGTSLGIPDTCGFFESNTNLQKCLYLGKKLKQYGAIVTYSHTKCGPWDYEKVDGTYPKYFFKDGDWQGNSIAAWYTNWVVDSATWYGDLNTNSPYRYTKHPDIRKYNRIPTLIAREVGDSVVNGYEYDCFISVHSNAPGNANDNMTNYPLFLYRGFDMENSKNSDESNNQTNKNISYYSPGSYEMADAAWRYCYELLEGVGTLCHPYREEPSVDKKFISGDLDFYYRSTPYPDGLHVDADTLTFDGTEYYSYLGVIRHMVPGFLAEGYYHSYGPARHCALNYDYCRMEGLAYFRGIRDYFGGAPETVGYICGVIKDNNTPALDHKDYRYLAGSHDQWMPCNEAIVILKKDGKEVKRYTCDNNYNGIFVFYELDPGTYTLESEYNGLTFSEVVKVEADKTTYTRLYPTTTPHICAYDLNVEQNGDSYTFSFYANSTAENANIIFYNNEKQEIGSYPISATKGANSITLSTLNLPGDAGQTLSWAVELTGKEITEFALIHSDNSLDMYSTSQLFNAVNTNPMSDNFGEIYVLHRAGRLKQEPTAAADNGLWVYDHELTKQNTEVYKGGSPFGHPTRMGIDSEGYLYISDWSDAQSGIYIANTADLTQNFTQFFRGTRDGDGKFTKNGAAIGSSTPGNFIYGEGKDTKLYVYDEDVVASKGVLVYNIGQEDGSILRTWGNAPSAKYNLTGQANAHGNVWVTSKGFFVSQNVTFNSSNGNPETHDELQFYNHDGTKLYASNQYGTDGGGFVVSPDENVLILNDRTNNFKIFDITWNGTTPTLALRTTYTHGLGAIRQMNWDYAGNLVCSGDDGIHIFTVPTNDNTTLVPARATVVKLQPQPASANQRIWAFDLKCKPTMAGYQFTFKSVANGVGSLTLKDEQGKALKSCYISSVTQGENAFTIPYDDMPQTRDDLSWEITLAAGAVQNVADVTPNGIEEYYFPQGVATNNNPESEHFGKIYMLDAYGKENTSGLTEEAGVYVYDALLQLENDFQKSYLPSNVNVKDVVAAYKYRILHRVAVNPKTDDVAFVQSKTNHLWIANPDNLNAAATNIGQNTYASSLCYDADGTLYIFGYEAPKDVDGHETKAIIYKKVGNNERQEFATIDVWESLNDRNSMASDGRGGLWIVSKLAGNGNQYGEFFHVNQEGEVDFRIKTDGTHLTAPKLTSLDNIPKKFYRGQVAYDAQRNILALGGDEKVTLFNVTYDNNTGAPTLIYWTATPQLHLDNSTVGIDGIAFDYAGDLIVVSATMGLLYKYSLPTDNNVCTTPAPTSQIIPHRFVLQDTKHNQTNLQSAMNQTVDALVCRSLTAGMYNTLCLPFTLNSFGNTPLEDATVLEYSHSEELDGDIVLYFSLVTKMEAGVPYLVEPQADIDVPMDFTGVQITETDVYPDAEPDANGISFNGILAPKTLTANDKSILFLVSGNRLAWASTTAEMYGMRGYFSLPEGKYDKLRTRARIVTSESTTTDIQQTTTTSTNAQKLILNGMLYILKDGQLYTVFGTKVK